MMVLLAEVRRQDRSAEAHHFYFMTRWLMNHPESDCLFEVFTEQELERSIDMQCDDVTGIEVFEEAFLKEYLEKVRAETTGSQI